MTLDHDASDISVYEDIILCFIDDSPQKNLKYKFLKKF